MSTRTTSTQGRNDAILERLDQWGTFVLANLLWVVLSIPLVTMPIATAGMFQVMSLRARGKSSEFFKDFIGGMRRYWLKATLIGVVDALIVALLAVNFYAFSLMGELNVFMFISRSITFFIALMLILVNLYVWSLLVVAEMTLRQIVVFSMKLVAAHPFRSFATLIVGLVPVGIGLLLPQIVFMFIPISAAALLINRGTWRIIRRYVPEDELMEYESNLSPQ